MPIELGMACCASLGGGWRGESKAWWVINDPGPIDGPHPSAEAAWDRVVEFDALRR